MLFRSKVGQVVLQMLASDNDRRTELVLRTDVTDDALEFTIAGPNLLQAAFPREKQKVAAFPTATTATMATAAVLWSRKPRRARSPRARSPASTSADFALAGAAGLGAVGAIALMPRIGSGAAPFREALLLRRSEWRLEALLDRRVLLASMLLVSVTLSTPVTTAFVPVHAQAVGVANIGLFYVAAGLTNIAARLILARMLDRGSRGLWFAIGFCVSIAAYAVFTQSGTIEMFIGAAVLNAIGQSLTLPTLMALAMDRAERERMGRAMATFSMFYSLNAGPRRARHRHAERRAAALRSGQKAARQATSAPFSESVGRHRIRIVVDSRFVTLAARLPVRHSAALLFSLLALAYFFPLIANWVTESDAHSNRHAVRLPELAEP